MRSMSIGNLFYPSIYALVLLFGLLLIFSSSIHLKAEETEASETQPQDSCVLIQNSQSPIWIKNATPNGRVAVLTGLIQDGDTLGKGECAGAQIALNPHRKIITLVMDPEGEKKGEIYIPQTSAKTGYMQMVDLSTCRVGDIKKIIYSDTKPDDSCIYSLPHIPKMYSGQVFATGTVFQSAPFCESTLKITGEATVTVFDGAAQVVQNLTRVFGVPGDGCYSGYIDSSQSIFILGAKTVGGSVVADGQEKSQNDTLSWSLSGDGEKLKGSFVNDHHYCCGRGNHTGTASGEVTLFRQQEVK